MNISDIPIYEQCKQLEVEIAELKAYKDVNEDFKTAWEELKAENETLKKVKDFASINLTNYIADNDKLKAENERLKEDYMELYQQKDLDNARWQKRCTDLHIEDKAKADKYWLVLQKIKAISEQLLEKGLEPQSVEHQLRLKGKRELASIVINLITKAEEE